MEIRAFAAQVLFATTLEEKLQCPDAVTDEHPGPALAGPDAPGRPVNLQFKPHGSGSADFPGMHRLEQERERGKLLHFFANHELLATELMALVLLKFPNAPAAFRKGVLQTLKDEQGHTRLYLERMHACGIEFGELPVSGYFWRCVAPMQHPIDYLAGLCLTFEQANLDFAGHFARCFGQVGDEATAQLLGKIYRDEIGHVAYGLKWFRRWKNPNENDWEAFCRTLKFPLSPQRAKGFSLNLEGRRAAGFDPQFIAELNVYSQSKGRTPSVFVFNPFAEGRIAEGRAFNPTRHQAALARDLENLPQFLCRQDDIVLVERRPAVEFLSTIKQAGFPLPEFVERSAELQLRALETPASIGNTPTWRSALQRKLGRLRPWAWSPDSVDLLAPLFASVTAEQRTGEQRFNPGIAQFYSKAWSAEFLRRFLSRSSRDNEAQTSFTQRASRITPPEGQSLVTSAATENWICTAAEVGVTASSLDDALAVIAAIRSRGQHRIVVKQAVGLAGRNAMRLFEPDLLENQRRWLANALRDGRKVVVEPWLERLADFSAQLEMTPGGLKLCGYTVLLNDAKGQYQGNVAESHHHTRIPSRIVALFREPPDLARRLLTLYADIFALLETELRGVDFLGPLGIDAFVYRDATGASRVKPIVEINPRYTMGRVAVELMRQTCQGSSGWFRLVNRAALRDEGGENFTGYAEKLTTEFPLRLEGEPVPRIREGALCLNDPAQAQACLAVFQVQKP
jgi:uncharacterized ferritin-like protein (DUF455 family)